MLYKLRKNFLLLGVILVFPVIAVTEDGWSAARDPLSLFAERRLGDRIARDLYRDPDYLDDPVIADYLQGIWQPLLASARKRNELSPELDTAFAWALLLGRDRTVNAFALPGGYFGIHLGLVGIVTSKDELASVMAHELSHVTQRHIARLISRQGEQAPWLLGAMILGALAAGSNPAGANAVIVGGQAVAAQSQLNFSRDMEREADRVGYAVSTQAGFAPQGFVSMFEKLQQSNRLNDTGNFPYLRSHPLTTERIADMRSRLTSVDAMPAQESLEHAMVAARARVLSNSSVDALRRWYVEAEPAVLAKQTLMQRTATLYGASLAAAKLRDFVKASSYTDALGRTIGDDMQAQRQWRLLRAEIASVEGKPEAALQLIGTKAVPKARPELALWVAAKIAVGAAADAADAAQYWVLDHPYDASLWQALASARAGQGRIVAAVRAEAEADVARLDYATAVTRLQRARDLARSGAQPTDDIEASAVDARLRQVEQLLREQAAER